MKEPIRLQERQLNGYLQDLGWRAHRLYALAEGSKEEIYRSRRPVNMQRLASIYNWLLQVDPDKVATLPHSELFASYQAWCMAGSGKDQPEFRTYTGSDGREHGEY